MTLIKNTKTGIIYKIDRRFCNHLLDKDGRIIESKELKDQMIPSNIYKGKIE